MFDNTSFYLNGTDRVYALPSKLLCSITRVVTDLFPVLENEIRWNRDYVKILKPVYTYVKDDFVSIETSGVAVLLFIQVLTNNLTAIVNNSIC